MKVHIAIISREKWKMLCNKNYIDKFNNGDKKKV